MNQDTSAASPPSPAEAMSMRPSTPTQPHHSPRYTPASRDAASQEQDASAASPSSEAFSPAMLPRRAATPTATSSPTAFGGGGEAHHHHHHLPVPKTPSRTSPSAAHGVDSPAELSIGIPHAHHMRPPVGGPPLGFRGPLPGGAGQVAMQMIPPSAVRRPMAMCELTPVIRNTSELLDDHHHHHRHGSGGGGGVFQDSFSSSSGVIVPDTGGGAAAEAHDRAAKKREQFLSLSVPASMGGGGGGLGEKGSEGGGKGEGRRGSTSRPGQLQQRPRRPLPQASPVHVHAGVPIPPRASSSLRSSGSSALSSSASGVAAALASSDIVVVADDNADFAGPPAPFLPMDSPPSGPRPAAAAAALLDGRRSSEPARDFSSSPPRDAAAAPAESPSGALPMPAPAVRSYSAGNLDMHSMVQTIREHLRRQQEDGGDGDRDSGYIVGGSGSRDDEGDDDYDDDEGASDARARARLSEALDASWESPARSLHRRPSPRALKPRDPMEELTHQVGLPAPSTSILHPSLPRHPSPTDEQLQEPYRPLREDSFEVGVKRVDRRELDSIFKQDKGPSPPVRNGGVVEGNNVVVEGNNVVVVGRRPLTAANQEPSFSSSSNRPKILRGSPPRHPGASQGSALQQHIPPAAPLAERDWSIPSIRLANQFRGSSLSFASYTCSEDDYTEEDNIYRGGGNGNGNGDYGEDENGYCYDDEATISTAGSLDVSNHLDGSSHLLRRLPIFEGAEDDAVAGDRGSGGPFLPRRSPPLPGSGAEVFIEGGMSAFAARQRSNGDLSDSAAAAASSSAVSASAPSAGDEAAQQGGPFRDPPGPWREEDEDHIHRHRLLSPEDHPLSSPPRASPPPPPNASSSSQRRRNKKEQKNQEAIAWLKSVEAGGISEAASSKFL
eukprot:CAMPEP_0113544214 /NCGR_PEP_ID=MMETSP0015_2-20120614/10587_1 /TAXON_ID=2838 /ORGANISM="Odontella" /LENGTH=893 /DNA_ID=CAMNT_0000444455 /DNA_START=676 /DNA_END=3354 /DNA_ORIENTATION=+ /assembly_acc=CAM_ASM_000160